MSTLSADKLKKEAHRLGFDLVGITSAEPPAHLEVFETWLKAQRHGQMGYLATERSIERRRDPRRILPECKTIIVLGATYQPLSRAMRGDLSRAMRGDLSIQDQLCANESPGADEILTGMIAAYACAPDYHDVLPQRLKQLCAWIEASLGHPVAHRIYTDSGPLLERELAQRAGLGWIGKNTCLINPAKGSYFLLAEILLDVDIQPDPPFIYDRCGSCKRCMEACPTNCILPDRTLDARHCISYLTIELKDAIPVNLRPALGKWVFGCDICQQVCPWNWHALRYSTPGSNKIIPAPRQDLLSIDLISEITLSPGDFNRKFKGTPVMRTKRQGYLRNVATALGNSRDIRAVPALAKVLQNEPEPFIRAHAAWALGKMNCASARQALVIALESETDETVLKEIHQALVI